MAVNLSRNTKVYYTSNVSADSGYTNYNTFEIQVLSGYSFTQKTDQQTIQITEAGATPNRGQRSFNTKLNPVDWSFSTYVRPDITSSAAAKTAAQVTGDGAVATFTCTGAHSLTSGDLVAIAGGTPSAFNRTIVPVEVVNTAVFTYSVGSAATGTASGTVTATKLARVTAVEKHLWNSLVGTADIYAATNTTPAWAESAGSATLSMTQSDTQALNPFSLVFKVDNTYYKVQTCAVNQAQISFGIDQIAQIQWTGFGTTYAEVTDTAGLAELATIVGAPADAHFITNKLSTVTLVSGIDDVGATAGTSYTLPLTGGDITIANNLTYLTPEILGIVNSSIGYYTGTRAVSGNMTAYLRTGAGNNTGKLLSDILATSASTPETAFTLSIEIGGKTNANRIELVLPAAMLTIPTIDIQDVVSTSVAFTGQKYLGTEYDLEAATPNELVVKYFAS